LTRFYKVTPGVLVERGIPQVMKQARREGIPEDFAGISFRGTVRR
jgi:hypothetical protein